jgi:hypothetical protein
MDLCCKVGTRIQSHVPNTVPPQLSGAIAEDRTLAQCLWYLRVTAALRLSKESSLVFVAQPSGELEPNKGKLCRFRAKVGRVCRVCGSSSPQGCATKTRLDSLENLRAVATRRQPKHCSRVRSSAMAAGESGWDCIRDMGLYSGFDLNYTEL